MVLDKGLLPAASLYHFTVPVVQLALKGVLSPLQIVSGVACILVGAFGTGLTVTLTFDMVLLQEDSHLT